MANVTIESFNATLDALLNANPHAKSKGDDFKDWCETNFNSSARISHIREQRQTTNRVSEQFRYFDPIVVFVCDEVVKRDVLIQYVSERSYRQLEVVAIIGVTNTLDENGELYNKYTYEHLLIYQHSDFVKWALPLFDNNVDIQAKVREGLSNTMSVRSRQIIFYGAPGTGKSQTIKGITDAQPKDNVFRTTFHPDSDYSTFVGCYKPTKNKAQQIVSETELVNKCKEYAARVGYNNYNLTQFGYDYALSLQKWTKEDSAFTFTSLLAKASITDTSASSYITAGIELYTKLSTDIAPITYLFVPQTFTKAYIRAYQTSEPVYLIIEEINRGNCAQIFGDLFQLLDRKDGVSEYPIKADNDLCNYIKEQLGEDSPAIQNDELILPANLYIWATMNTSDQSLFPIDSAFKRRWEWKYTKIVKGIDKQTGQELNWQLEDGTDWWDFLQHINAIIDDMTQSADKQLGYFFCKDINGIISYDTFVSKVVFYLYNDIFKTYSSDDYSALFEFHQIQNDGTQENKTSRLVFPEFYDGAGQIIPKVAEQFIQNVLKWEKKDSK